MKTIKIFFILFCLIPSLCFAGNKDSSRVKLSPCISINGGIGIPSSFNDFVPFNGYALIGPFANIYATFPVTQSHFGFAGMLDYGSNAIDMNTYLREAQGVNATSISKGNYTVITSMVGIFETIPVNHTTIDFHFLVGILYFNIPRLVYNGVYYTYSHFYPNIEGTWVENGTSNLSFGIDLGVSIKSKLTKRFFWLLNADFEYSGLNGGFNITPQFTTANLTNYTPFEDIYSDLAIFNLSAGIGYKFGK